MIPLVSVAIITYNQKKYLKECIDSVLEQDYPNIEIVIADDASTDGTQDMLLDYKSKHEDKFVLKLSGKNQGITKNSNLAHFACSGKYIAWMGGDDLMLPKKISIQVNFMEKNPNCAICYHNLDVFDSTTNKTIYFFNKKSNKLNGDISTVIKHGTFNGACSTMIRASKAPKMGFNEILPVASDWLYWIDTLSSGGTINYIDNILGRYRRHNNNITNKYNSTIGQNHIDHLNTCNILLSKYPQFLNEIRHSHSNAILSLRRYLPYGSTLIYALMIKPTFKLFLAIAIHFITFKKLKP